VAQSKKSSGRRQATKQSGNNTARNIIIGGIIAVAVVALGVLLYLSMREPATLADLQRTVGLSRGHDENAVYEDTGLPPMGGVHSDVWQNCGVYDAPIEAKNAVHSMEHGAVWVTYQPDLPADDVATLRDDVSKHSYTILSPFEGLKSPVVLTAWGIQLTVDSAGDSRIADFLDRYVQGPQTPELGATCSDGIGTPIAVK
jgi:hypothetical protein